MDLPRIGQPAPTFTCKAAVEDRVYDLSLSDYKNKYVVLLFFPMDFNYVCPTVAFSDYRKEFKKINTEIIACSIESHFAHLKWLSMPQKDGGIRGIHIPLIADKSMTIAKQYGILNEEEGYPYRSTFIIDDKGILRCLSINDRPVGRSTVEIYRLVEAIQYAEKTGEITPKFGLVEVSSASGLNKSSSFLRCKEKITPHEFIE